MYDHGGFVRWTPGEIPVKDTKLTISGLIPEDKEVLKKWKESASEIVMNDATKHYSLYIQRMDEFFNKNPKATYEEANDYSRKLMLPHTINQVSAILNTRIEPVSGNLSKRMNSDYKTDKEVIDAVKSGSLSKQQGSDILMNQFGYSK